MVTYLENERILFSNDLFGQNLGAEVPLDTEFSPYEVKNSAQMYFEKVFSPSTMEERSLGDVMNYYQSVC